MSNVAVRSEPTLVRYGRQPLVSDEAWTVIAPLFPSSKTTGRPQKWPLQLWLEAVLYLLRTGCQWRALPDVYPPYSTVQRHFYALILSLSKEARCGPVRADQPSAGDA